MKIVRFETPDAIFSFTLEDLVTVLNSHASEDLANELMDFLKVQPGDVIDIPPENRSFPFVVLHLLASNKGNVFCKTCGREYQANELVPFPVGAGENPLKVKVGHPKRLLKRLLGRQKRMPLFGGKGIDVQRGMR